MNDAPWYTRHPLSKSAYKALKRARSKVFGFFDDRYYRHNLAKSQRIARSKVAIRDGAYDKYVREQLEETLLKKRLKGEVHFDVVPLIDMLAAKYDVTGKSVLCVGCRNRDEILYFRKKGASEVVGIDLFGDHPEIQVMDMHDLKFPDNAFDVVYSRHSFEHAYDKRQAAQEFVRVLRPAGVVVIEVPGKYKGGADYNRFDSLDDVLVAFEPHVGEFLRKEYSSKEENTDKMDIIRLMFHVSKSDDGKSSKSTSARA
jgi:SAM-dependent methyltransferase